MIEFPYEIKDSMIPGAGKGLFTQSKISAGKVLIAPSRINNTLSLQELMCESSCIDSDSSVRWFESSYTLSPDWPDECYVNHSFSPNGLWHLGFLFALHEIAENEEITMDYSHIIVPDHQMGFCDSVTGEPIIGLGWKASLLDSTERLLHLAKNLPEIE